MASKLPTVPDNSDDLLYVKKVIKGKETYCGYKREYLARNLSVMEQSFILCKLCKGIMKEATINRGETTCLVCSETPNELNAVNIVQNSVMALEIKCPILRDCTWSGKLSSAERHLKICDSYLIECGKCDRIFTRRDERRHNTKLCPLRLVYCEYNCNRCGAAQDVGKHYEVCTNYPINCPNGCGLNLQRKEMATHRGECELEEVACPFSEYGCKANPMLRKDLVAHKREYVVEHQDITLAGLSERISKLEKEKTEMSWKLRTMKQLDGVEWIIEDLNKLESAKQGPTFYVNNYKLRLYITIIRESNLGFKELHFAIRRVEGEFDKQLGLAFISHYRVIIVDKQNYANSLYADGPMKYLLAIGKDSEYFHKMGTSVYKNYITARRQMYTQFCFDINTHMPLNTYEEVSVVEMFPTISNAQNDPFH